MHHLSDGSVAWQWHGCVACARVTGRLANHARFSVHGQPSACPIAERANDRVFEILPSELHKRGKASTAAPATAKLDSRLRYQDTCIQNSEKHRGELMSALGTALMQLHTNGLSYPAWVWELYEKSRVERSPLNYITNT